MIVAQGADIAFGVINARLAPVNDQPIFNFDDVEVDERRSKFLPWIVIGVISIIAILISLIVINTMGNRSERPEPTPSVASPDPDPTPEPTAPTTDPAPTTEPTPTPPPAGTNPDDAIDTSGVVVGETWTADVPYEGWNVTIDVSSKLSPWTYVLEGADNRRLILNSELIDKLPASCDHLKSKWGIERVGDGEFVPYTPQEMCEENESLYIEILGLVRAIPPTIQPMD